MSSHTTHHPRVDQVEAPADVVVDQSNHALVRRFLDAVEHGDLDTALAQCRTDVRYTIPGRGVASGDHVGHHAVRDALRTETRLGAEVRQFLTHAVVGDGAPVVSYHEIIATIDGQPQQYRMLLLFGFTGGLIDAIHEFTDDQYLADDLFSAGSPPTPEPDPPRRWLDRVGFPRRA